ncbi:hypothetical protein F5X96DRAFT_632001 [Biscogniauxia mediterranea]|nr:hypothetical protein F5X96DRAFT_632001 [Biscogniauxia mediterranea]
MLSVVSFDMVAKRLWRFLAHPPHHHGPQKNQAEGGRPPVPPHRMGTSKAGISSGPGADLITANSDAGGSSEQQHSPRAGSSIISISVGEFHVPEEEQVFVIGMLIIRILRRIREGLDEARRRVARGLQYEKNERFGVPPTNSLAALMLENVYGSLGVLEQSLRGFVLR